ncbi:hypothetical protein RISK_000555 [Rhodopirellula islandica]|uniref:Uncharacterized protein n=1 Tax=Rhodopirellula islandica TaxID=595434 RepID=A0A0J1BLX9_RHOIS|nr:hypothetical protein RISK_000555 [Rhodopirellula islandica]
MPYRTPSAPSRTLATPGGLIHRDSDTGTKIAEGGGPAQIPDQNLIA